MKKDKIIIADEDPAYLASLLDKFSEDLFNRIELVVISDAAFFAGYFSEPREAEILIVSENLYNPELCRHSLQKIFLLTEEARGDSRPDGNPVRICRYTGIRELYGEIIGRSAGILQTDRAHTAASQILAVTSAAGGTGKTTVAMGLGMSFVKTGRRVLYLNCEKLQTFQYLLNGCSPVGEDEVYACLSNPGQEMYPAVSRCFRTEGFRYMPPLRAPLMTLGISREAYLKLAREARQSQEYDYVIVDTDSVFDEDKVRLLDLADKAVIVTEQTSYHASACNSLFCSLAETNPEKYFVLCNKYDENAENALAGPKPGMRFTVEEYIRKADSYESFRKTGFTGDEAMRRAVWLLG